MSGTDQVLDAISRMGLCCAANPFGQDRLVARIHDCMMKAISFILQHQNPNGGRGGETIEADLDVRSAGRSESRSLQTASVLFDQNLYPVRKHGELYRGGKGDYTPFCQGQGPMPCPWRPGTPQNPRVSGVVCSIIGCKELGGRGSDGVGNGEPISGSEVGRKLYQSF